MPWNCRLREWLHNHSLFSSCSHYQCITVQSLTLTLKNLIYANCNYLLEIQIFVKRDRDKLSFFVAPTTNASLFTNFRRYSIWYETIVIIVERFDFICEESDTAYRPSREEDDVHSPDAGARVRTYMPKYCPYIPFRCYKWPTYACGKRKVSANHKPVRQPLSCKHIW